MATSFAYPFDCFMGLQSDGAEVSGTGYVRRPTTFVDTGDGIVGANISSVQWPACGSDWGAIDTVSLLRLTLTAGSLLCTGAATSPVRGNMYDELRVSAGGYAVVNTAGGLIMAGGGIGSPYDVGGYGVGPYEMLPATILLFHTFGTVALCGGNPGIWAPGPFDVVTVS